MREVLTGMTVTVVSLLLCGSQVVAAEEDVDVELVLAVDVSNSMDFDEQLVQRRGYIAAFRHPEVISAIAAGPSGRIAVTYAEWGGAFYQRVVVPWRLIETGEDAMMFAAELEAAPITQSRRTSISAGLMFSAGLFEENGFSGMRQTIDVSGDGPNNEGYRVDFTRDIVVNRGFTINGLAITIRPTNLGALGPFDLDTYYEDCVIGGPGAFVVSVDDIEGFEVAIRRKLVLEIAGLTAQIVPAAVFESAPRVNCLVGEWSRGLR